jgi:YVTN family beta-propeller protein
MRAFSRSVVLALAAFLISVVVFGYGSQASGPQADLPTVVTTVGVGSGSSNDGPEGVGVDTVTNHIFVANSRDNNIYVVNGATNAVVATIDHASVIQPQGVAVNPISRKVYVANGGNRSVTVLNADSMSFVKEITGLGPGPTSIAIDSGANLVYVTNLGDSGGPGNSVSIINGATDALQTAVVLPFQYPYGIALDVPQHRLYVTHRWGDSGQPRWVSVIDTVSLAVDYRSDYPMSELTGIVVRPSAGSVFVAQRSNAAAGKPSLGIFDFAGGVYHNLQPWNSGLPLTSDGTTFYFKPIGVAYNPASERVFVNSYDQNAVVVVDAITLQVVSVVGVGANPDLGIAVNPDTSRVYVANRSSGTLTVIQDGAAGPTPTPTNTATPTPLPCVADAYEPDNTAAQARVIIPTFGYTQSHSFCGTAAPWETDKDWVTFAATAPVTLTMFTSNLTGGADTMLTLYGPDVASDATKLKSDTDGGGGLASRIVYSITTSGLYFLQVERESATATAAKLTAMGISPAASSLPQRNYDLTVEGGPPLSNRVFLPLVTRD